MGRSERRQFEREQKKGVLLSKSNKSKNSSYLILLVLFIIFLLSQRFVASKTIGEDYSLTTISTLLGLASIGIYKRTFLREKLQTTDKYREKIIIILFYSVQGLIFSYLSFGNLINISWSLANNSVAKNSRQEYYNCSITGLLSPTSRGGPSVWYEFKNKPELCHISYEQYYILEKGNWKKYTINVRVRKGIGNCYILDNLEIY